MAPYDAELALAPRLRAMRIILAALMAGLGLFCLIALGLRTQGALPRPQAVPVLTYVGFAVAAGLLPVIRLVPDRIVAVARRGLAMIPPETLRRADTAGLSPDAAALLAAYQTRLIISAALIESIGYYFLVAYFVDGHWASPVVAGLCLAALAVKFPTQAGVERWLERQQELLHYERSQT